MLALLRETNALREPILQIKNTIKDIFEFVKGLLYLSNPLPPANKMIQTTNVLRF